MKQIGENISWICFTSLNCSTLFHEKLKRNEIPLSLESCCFLLLLIRFSWNRVVSRSHVFEAVASISWFHFVIKVYMHIVKENSIHIQFIFWPFLDSLCNYLNRILTHSIWQIQLWCLWLKWKYGWNFSISGRKMMMKSGLGNIFEIPPCAHHVIFITEFWSKVQIQ